MSRQKTDNSRNHQGISALVIAVLLAIIGIASLVWFVISQQSPPMPTAGQSSQVESDGNSSENNETVLSYSRPVSISIPAINVTSELLSLGQNPDGTVAVPSGENYNKAAWYNNSPTPGQLGATIIEGHLDYEGRGPAIFYRLGDLKPGDKVSVKRQDGKTVIYSINNVATYQKDNFPTEQVYQVSDKVALRLITCGGTFNGDTDEYESNIIAFASLDSIQQP